MSATASKPMELIVAVSGTITKSNFDDFRMMAEDRIKALNFEPTTDEEFGQAEQDVKGLAKFEKDLGTAEQDVLKQMDEVYQLVSGIGELKKLSAESRLRLKKQIDSQKKVVRAQIKRAALSTIPLAHPQAEARIEAAMKGKRTLDSLRAAADAEAETIAAEIERVRLIVDDYRADHEDILHDEHKLLVMDCQIAEAELSRRVERKASMIREAQLKAEAERARKEAEESKARKEAEVEEVEKVEQIKPDDQPDMQRQPELAQSQDRAQELLEFINAVRQSFVPIRDARAALKDDVNIELAGKFAFAVKSAFSNLKGGLK